MIEAVKTVSEKVFAVSAKMGMSAELRDKSGIGEVIDYFVTDIIPKAFVTKKQLVGAKLFRIASEINVLREDLKVVTDNQKNELEVFRKAVARYNLDNKNLEQSLKNWQDDFETVELKTAFKDLNRYFLVNGIEKDVIDQATDYVNQFEKLEEDSKRLPGWYAEIERQRESLQSKYLIWEAVFMEYNSKLVKPVIDKIVSFFSGSDYTEEKSSLTCLSKITKLMRISLMLR